MPGSVAPPAQLDYVPGYWADGRWGVDLETLADLLAESWHNILRAPGPDAPPA